MPADPHPRHAAIRPVVLLILDGWGHREEREDNALAQARLPNWDALVAGAPHTLIHTEGRHVGLPDGQMGNSEVGHMNLGAGRIVYQDLTRIDAAIEDGSFNTNGQLLAACRDAREHGRTLHLMALLSPGGVHSHERHLHAMIELAHREGVPRVAVHIFLDGRDMPPRSAGASIDALQAVCDAAGNARVASVSGRYYAMDRDQRWDRVRRAWDAMVEASSDHHAPDARTALSDAYARGENDEFVLPTVIDDGATMRDGDAVVFMNFRADRARQLTGAFVADEAPFDGEQRILVPSPKVATYDLQPEMSCPEVTERLVAAIRNRDCDLAVCNIANPDMVGHTGNLAAAVQAAEAVDVAIGAIAQAVRDVGGALLVTADHGNLEMMRDASTGQPHTAHTVGPVPFVYVGTRDGVQLRSGGALRDVAPTILDLLGLPQPAEMTGRSLLD